MYGKKKINNIKFLDKPIKVLGFYFGKTKIDCAKVNLENKFEKTNNLMKSWEKMHLTIIMIIDKILMFKSLIIAQFTYLASTTVINRHIFAIKK